mmetsp:Transcript_46727/g.108976  ORF Transcript_46727/g.108976 Transcript_46727/m.108976 type:complete len:887 (-) Transcript_46727:124-2784(-)
MPAGSSQRNVSVQPDTGPVKRISSGAAWTVKDDPLEEGRVPSKEKDPKQKRIVARLRAMLIASSWYHSRLANGIRKIMTTKTFALLMVAALCLALFLPDTLVVAGANSNLGPDIVLTFVMFLFLFEMAGLFATDAAYMFSFFNLMDVLGTVSMISDISYMLGTDATAANATDGRGGSTQASFILLRATRAAKIGARAGRLSRVVKLLRLLPGIAGSDQQVGMAKVISTQLANLLATRVAGLTIVLVMVIPLFDILTFPQLDYSMRAWAQRLMTDLEEYRDYDLFEEELASMAEFYKNRNYGPYTCCRGYLGTRDGEDYFFCEESFDHIWNPTFSKPPRKASIDIVYADGVMVGFNMWTTQRIQSGMTMLSIVFIIFIMVFSGLALSSVVTELAVRPLERMLSTVRQIATTVFNFSSKVTEEVEDEETADINSASEMKLLEKVVNKLAVITDLHTRNEMDQIDAMDEEDIGIINMMQGRDVKAEKVKNTRRSQAVGLKRGIKTITTPQNANSRWEDLIGVPETLYLSWGLNTLSLTKNQGVSLAIFTLCNFHDRADGFVSTAEEEATVQKFVQIIENEYLPNPFHNFAHAVDVLHITAKLLRDMSSECFLTELEQYSLLVAAIGHDLGHPGVNNGFLSEVGHELALQYNDQSVLENMHCAKLYTIIGNREANVFENLTKEQYKECRKVVIETILHTDMMGHMAMVKDLQVTYEMNCEVFERHGVIVDGVPAEMMPDEHEVFSKDEATKLLVMSTVLHAADVSNPCRAWEVTHAWAWKCLEEFFEQGDREKEFGIPVQFLNDRDKLNRPNSQIGFIEFMIAPFVVAQVRLWPKLHEMGDSLTNNLALWEEEWNKEVSPAEEERNKVLGRVARVKDNMEAAKMRAQKAA